MSEYDGQIIIDSHIDTSGFEKDSNKISKDMKALSDKIKNGFKNGKFDFGTLDTSSLEKAKASMDALVNYKHKIAKELSENIPGGISYSEFINQSEQLQQAYDKLEKKIKSLKETSAYNNQNDITKDFPKINKPFSDVDKRIKNTYFNLSYLNKGFKNLGDTASKAFSKIRNDASKIPNVLSPIGNLLNKILRIAQFQVLRQLVRAIINEVKKSFVDLATYSQPFNKSIQSVVDSFKNFANAIMSVFAPILSALAPIISTITNMLTGLANNIAFVTNALFGNGQTAVIADTSFQGYSKSLNQTSKETKKAKKNSDELFKGLAKFDKLDILNKKKKDSGVGSSVSEIPKAMKMFKTVKIPTQFIEFANKLKETLKPLAEEAKKIGNSFINNFFNPVSKHIKESFLPRFFEDTRKGIENTNFEPLNNALDHFFLAMSKITITLFDALNWAWREIFIPIGKWHYEKFLPAFIDALASSIGALNAVIQAGKPLFKVMFDFLKDIGAWTGDIIINALKFLKERLDDLTKWIEDNPQKFRSVIEETLKWAGILLSAKGIYNAIKAIKNILFICSEVIPLVTGALGGLGVAIEAFAGPAAIVLAVLKQIWDMIQKLAHAKAFGISHKHEIEQLKNESGEDPERLADNLKRWRESGNRNQKEVAEELIKQLPFHLQKRVRGYATGTVVSPNKKFLAMLGDNTREPEVVSPISTMEQAMSNVLARTNGGGNVTLQLDGETFARLITPYMNSENARLGVSMVSGV